jgi:signal transduction histidine kinase
MVFERFYRSPGAAGEGTGMGLAIVRDIARMQGAQIVLGEADSGRGLRISVTFPPI